MIIAGLGVILFGFGNHGCGCRRFKSVEKWWLLYWWCKRILFALSIVVASYQGIELIGMTAGEAAEPKKTIIEAVQSTLGRILIFILVRFLSL